MPRFQTLARSATQWAVLLSAIAPTSARSVWFDAPAERFTQSCPLGNGRIGAMFFGGIDQTRIVLNESGMWSGSPQDADREGASDALPEIRRLLLAGDNAGAERLVNRHFTCAGLGSNHGRGKDAPYGAYQVLGDLKIRFAHPHVGEPANGYRRELDLADATLSVGYQQGGVRFTRQAFVSKPDEALAIRLSADRPGMQSFTVELTRPERAEAAAEGNEIVLSGQLPDGNGAGGVRFVALLSAVVQGGSVAVEDQRLRIAAADSVVLYVTAATDIHTFAGRRVDNPIAAARADMRPLLTGSFDQQRRKHAAEFAAHHQRVKLRLGADLDQHAAASLPTPDRLSAYANDPTDADLMATYFDFGRYLLISASRPGGLPANLQGIWAEELQTPWNADWHSNVNVQMNYWAAETCNLSAMHEPLFALIGSLVEPGRATARSYYGAPGWVGHLLVNPWGFTSPGESASWGSTVTCSAWLCQHLWDHYLFTLDKEFLAAVYPTLRGAARFYGAILIREPKHGWLVTAPSNSPENAFLDESGQPLHTCMGPAFDQQLLRYLFGACIEASLILDRDAAFREELVELRAGLAPNQIGSDGRILEWLTERPEAEPHHRHISHLWALYPGAEITPSEPRMADAARRSLDARGDGGTGWAIANKACMWARLGDGDRALRLLNNQLRPVGQSGSGGERWAGGTYPNLFDAHPPFQIDGNLGAPAAVAEMLLQSRLAGTNSQAPAEIVLLPALPSAWPTGSVTGLCARGGFEVDIAWERGGVTQATIKSNKGYPAILRYGQAEAKLDLKAGAEAIFDVRLQRMESDR